MKTRQAHQTGPTQGAFTLLELLLVTVIIAILAALSLPVLSKAKGRSHQIECLSQLRQVGVASLSFAHDHGDRFPFQVPVKQGGTLEMVKSASQDGADIYFAFRHFQALSNDLSVARLLRCPSDNRESAATFDELDNDNISYFLAVTADPAKPDSLLAGDRNIISSGSGSGSILKLTALEGAKWTRAIHEFKGNLLFAGGHVERTVNAGLQVALVNPDGPVKVWVPNSPPTSAKNNSSSGKSSPPSAAAGGGGGGFEALQRFFATPAGSSSAQSAPPPPPVTRSPQVAVRGAGGPAPEPPPQIQLQELTEPKPVEKPPTVLAVVPPILELAVDPVPVVESEETQEPLAFFVAPERCWWCWWLMIAAGLLTAFILGFIVHRRRRAQQISQGWTPHWQAPHSPGPR